MALGKVDVPSKASRAVRIENFKIDTLYKLQGSLYILTEYQE